MPGIENKPNMPPFLLSDESLSPTSTPLKEGRSGHRTVTSTPPKNYIRSDSEESGYNSHSRRSDNDYDSDSDYSSLNSSHSDTEQIELAQLEQKLSKVSKALPSYKQTSKSYAQCLLHLYQKMHGEKHGTILFAGDSMAAKETSTVSSPNASVITPDYTPTSYVGWNPVSVVQAVNKNGRPGEQNTIAFNVINSKGFQALLIQLITQPDTPEHQAIIQNFFSPEEFTTLSDRYYNNPDAFATFSWTGWNKVRLQSREYNPDETMPDHDLKKLHEQGTISDAELSYQLNNPKYNIDKKLNRQGSYDLVTSLEGIGQLPAKRDIGQDRWHVPAGTDFHDEITKRKGRPVAGPSGTTFRLLTIGKLISPALQKTMNDIPEEHLHELLVAQCLAYVSPYDHSMTEVEMAAQDVGIYEKDRSITELFTHDIHYGTEKNERINQQMVNDLMDTNNQ
ncbi:hypothetical protein CI610_00743 [invertebrate metagenome]|uniref:Uncharacterized protein n=1 Tax=invertebrate metagenome TaxID=1711999 RepID=A0A2H9TAJ6_9ZZZZ